MFRSLILFCGCVLLTATYGLSRPVQIFVKRDVKEKPALKPYLEKSVSYLKMRRFDSARIVIGQSLPLAIKYNDSVAIGKIFYNLALCDRSGGNFSEAKKNIRRGIGILTGVGHSKYLANSMYLLTIIIADEGNIEGAITLGLKNLKFFESIGETDDLNRTYGLLNSLFSDFKDPVREKLFREQFLLSIKRSKDHIFRSLGFSMIALDYEARSDYRGAWPFWLESL